MKRRGWLAGCLSVLALLAAATPAKGAVVHDRAPTAQILAKTLVKAGLCKNDITSLDPTGVSVRCTDATTTTNPLSIRIVAFPTKARATAALQADFQDACRFLTSVGITGPSARATYIVGPTWWIGADDRGTLPQRVAKVLKGNVRDSTCS